MEVTNKKSILKRGDVVGPRYTDGLVFYGRVWKCWDTEHVLVICSGLHVTLYRVDELVKLSYKGRWVKALKPSLSDSCKNIWVPMTSLKRLKKRAARYYPFFGGRKWTRSDKDNAYRDIQTLRFQPREHSRDFTEQYRLDGLLL